MIGSDKIDVSLRRSLFAGSICSAQRSALRTPWCWTNANPLAIAVVCLIAALFVAGVAAKAEDAVPSFRLPDLARPTHYTLEMTIVASEPESHGVAMIEVELKRATDVVWLNQKGLTVQQARVRSGGAA